MRGIGKNERGPKAAPKPPVEPVVEAVQPRPAIWADLHKAVKKVTKPHKK
jgi:hypothetical protein